MVKSTLFFFDGTHSPGRFGVAAQRYDCRRIRLGSTCGRRSGSSRRQRMRPRRKLPKLRKRNPATVLPVLWELPSVRLAASLAEVSSDKKSEPSSARKISEKEAATFESAKISRVKDARSEEAAPPVVLNQPVDVHLQRGRELLNAGKVNEAIAELTAAQSADPKSAEIQNLLGVAYGSKGMNDRALKAFEAAVRADKDNAQYLNNYGFLLLQTNNFETAVKHLKRAAKLSPNDARIWNNLAIAQCQRGKFDEAYQSFVRAVGEYDGRVNMAAQLLAQGHGQEAIKHLEVAHSLRPESIEVLARLAGLYRMTGRITDAETARRNLMALQTSAEVQK